MARMESGVHFVPGGLGPGFSRAHDAKGGRNPSLYGKLLRSARMSSRSVASSDLIDVGAGLVDIV